MALVSLRRLLFSADRQARSVGLRLAPILHRESTPNRAFTTRHNHSSFQVTFAPPQKKMPKRTAAAAASKKAPSEEPQEEKPKRGARGRTAKAEEQKMAEQEAQQEEPKKKVGRPAKAAAKEKEAPAPKEKKERAVKTKAEKPPVEEKPPADEKPTRARRQQKAKENNNIEEQTAPEETKPAPKKRATKRAVAKKPAESEEEENDKAEPEEEEEVEEQEEKPKPKRGRKADDKKPMNKTETDYKEVSFGCERKNAKGEEYNFKISSWNVDGLRSWLKKGGVEFLEKEEPDILCLQETKCSEGKIPEELKQIEGYHSYWCGSKKEGYAGVAVLAKKEPIEVKYGIGQEDHDEEGRCITAEFEEFYLVNVYVPNAGRKLVTLPKRLEWNAAFKAYIKGLDAKKPVILCGDMNVAHEEIDLANPKTNTKNAGFTKEEREGLTEFLADGYVDTFRRLYPEQKDAYTFWSYMSNARAKNVGWRLDYFIVSDRLMEQVCDNQIRHQVFGSDHCPVTMFIHI